MTTRYPNDITPPHSRLCWVASITIIVSRETVLRTNKATMLESTIAFGSYAILFVFSYFSFTEYLFRNYENSKSVTLTFAITLAYL